MPSASSLPVWEEWIEIVLVLLQMLLHLRLFPYGKSGLKFSRGCPWIVTHSLFPYGKSGLKCQKEGVYSE